MTPSPDLAKARATYVAAVDPAELAIRIIEAESGLRRPPRNLR